MFEKQLAKLNARKKTGNLRSLSLHTHQTDFFSNDYLGLSKFKGKALKPIGSTGSRLLSGNTGVAEHFEEYIANYFCSEESLTFNSGYTANLAVLSSIPQRGDTIIFDEFVHASIRDGIRLSFANSLQFKHNNLIDLEDKLKSIKGNIYIVTEGLFSMEGDLCPLHAIVKLSKKYKACVILDEAHSAGVFGHEGRGLAHGMNLQNEVQIRIITYGKAFGYHGASVLCNDTMKQFLINFARPFIYTTAPSHDFYIRLQEIIENGAISERQKKLHNNINCFVNRYKEKLNSEINSPIQIIEKEMNSLNKICERMKNNGIYSRPIYSPTVPLGKERIRICLHSFNKISELKLLLESLIL